MDEKQPANWDLDTDEIASVASEDLYENRPNRWTGPASTWRELTREERLLWRSMQQLADRDLAVHLYDTFALKRQGRDQATAQGLTVWTQDGQQQTVWAPPKMWTAWPLKEEHVPTEGLFPIQHDEEERFTLRKRENRMPSTELRDELAATVLRLAKERYRRRSRHPAPHPSIESPSSPLPTRSGDQSEDESSLPSSPPVPSTRSGRDSMSVDHGEDGSGEDKEDEDLENIHTRQENTYRPTVSSNDDLSNHLLRPSVRHMLTQLDRTLTILHNARVAGLSYLSASESSTEEDSEAGTHRNRGRRGRPRRTPQPGEAPSSSEQRNLRGSRRRGRPRKIHTPRQGETEEEMRHRVAREGHRRLPVTAAEKDAAFEAWLEQGYRRERERSGSTAQSEASIPQIVTGETNVERKLRRWGLRDWSDVLGAAALAGFSDSVIARTAKRCADLFGQGMVIRRLDEVPSARVPPFISKEYRPSKIQLASSSAESESEPAPTLSQRRITSRQASLARSSRGPSPATPRRRSLSRSGSRSCSRSSAGLLFCPIPVCDRAAKGFSRRANLRRHMNLVHPGHASGDDDSDDEVVGAVHTDGFLKTIHPSRGWRGEDVLVRKRKRYYGRSSS
ncbi:RNA polymerase I specific transcription initiation factor, RRN9 [Metarhizium album ARSEF 1941]|uniref:RNA polymerase I specific transcription initiation factor, RRN9 n=1 Tax=Metarhizium album (strain ARSEF 1941) TaxID=1081103 RepID=A0A0B2WKX1_METAS|nr:RNA polymerase I specific transcription initiation factor, RRN9 [Metarhizium album ARSEF 1941]KHN96701.1 RNA polymerase I specific transcription initiation factor, RRN9 [Metarhizium album ARSEF 1941]